MQKGQAAIEFIFLILIVIIYLVTVTIPLAKDSQNALTDIENIARLNNETQKISNSISDLSTMGIGSKQTLILFLPDQSAKIYCKDKNISYEIQLTQKPYPAQCPTGKCTKTFNAPTNTTLNCATQLISGEKINLILKKTAQNQITLETP